MGRTSNKSHHIISSLRLLPAGVAVMLSAAATYGCGGKETTAVADNVDAENFATMTSTQVSTLISDSGITRYRIDTPLWLVFDQASEPRWTFPKGMHLEKYDNFFRIDATVDCDSATYFKSKQLWRLDGYVDITNMANEKFLTQQLFWDQRNQKIYSDSFIHIERADRIIEGYGFVSNDKMTKYHVVNVSGIFPVERGSESSNDSNAAPPADTVQTSAFGVQGRPGLRPTIPRSSQRRNSSHTATEETKPEQLPKPRPANVTKRRSRPERFTPINPGTPVELQPSDKNAPRNK